MSNAEKIILLTNSFSGKGTALKTAELIGRELKAAGISYDLRIDQWPEDLRSFKEAWIVGGDGTVNFFINKYPGTGIPVAVFKGGTGNDLAWKLYGDITPAEQVKQVLEDG